MARGCVASRERGHGSQGGRWCHGDRGGRARVSAFGSRNRRCAHDAKPGRCGRDAKPAALRCGRDAKPAAPSPGPRWRTSRQDAGRHAPTTPRLDPHDARRPPRLGTPLASALLAPPRCSRLCPPLTPPTKRAERSVTPPRVPGLGAACSPRPGPVMLHRTCVLKCIRLRAGTPRGGSTRIRCRQGRQGCRRRGRDSRCRSRARRPRCERQCHGIARGR
jgi:hypothetical protein